MGINTDLYHKPAIRGDVTGPAINTSGALTAIAQALELITKEMPGTARENAEFAEKMSTHIATIKEASQKLEATFDRLTGWTPD